MENISVKQWIIALILVGLIAFGIGNLFGVRNANFKNSIAQKDKQNQDFNVQNNISKSKANEIQYFTVYVTGAVKNPDVYELPTDSIVKDAILKAGGADDDANLVAINLAKKITDGEEIIIPKKGDTVSSSNNTTNGKQSDGKININIANANTLEELPGIGEVKANAIINYRKSHGQFTTTHDITRVSGIGDKTFEKIKSLITIG